MTSTAADVLRRALERLGPSGEMWRQDAGNRHEGTFCMLTACSISGTTSSEVDPACALLRAAIGEQWVSSWNDREGRTFAEVKAAFEKAITLAEQGEAQ